MKAALLAGETRERQAAKDKGAVAKSTAANKGAAADAKRRWGALSEQLLGLANTALVLPLEERFLELRVDAETGMPTTEGVEALRAKLG